MAGRTESARPEAAGASLTEWYIRIGTGVSGATDEGWLPRLPWLTFTADPDDGNG
ncbi:hypothetical protein [Mycobacterium sp.]|uniref:hypothetical protein n=1 Tax=Mycobacterium sp. TaxID=1785 RepID=UPI002C98899B|nr:hypothetical protein [Mycobacterium sp.]HTQ22731.1 hypothetical protein [Mycobacterium sp.]